MNKYSIFLFSIILSFLTISFVQADHSWGNYHWARTSNPFTLELGDGVSSVWDSSLNLASQDWTSSDVLNAVIVPSKVISKVCKATAGRVEVCNSKYGRNGWLGVAQIWVNGEHITQGTVKLNDTYFNMPEYNNATWRNFVVCQEIGHTFGLDHQDENFNNTNLGTCMDYTTDPSINQHPNQHDYDQLVAIYTHTDPINTLISPLRASDVSVSERSQWGQEVKKDSNGNSSVFRRDLENGEKVFTFVIWAE